MAGILLAMAYLVRTRPILNQAASWTGWLAVTTPDVRIGSADLITDVVGAMEDALEAAGLADASRAAAVLAESGAMLARNAAYALDYRSIAASQHRSIAASQPG